ncbi:phosphotransferase [Streptosporangium sp. NBC_01810]|uniref:phosphotransferase n=1 Tax=Streptosporangium sp. NBC_01810 TaxID=2975951 RepID=UPI002DDA78DA|nr:phosphotransferase [Streptosporangium sp. NBC_01810]WSA26471.1 phosphotransferase [Streptosporangium sp. NBC_01810]
MATYTSLDKLDPGLITARYGLPDLELEALSGGAANSSFKATSAAGTFVLTVLDNYVGQADADVLAAHTETLFRLGMPTVEIIRNLDGDRISMIGERPILLKRWIEGRVVEQLPDHLYAVAGGLLARLHRLPPTEMPDLPVGTRRLSAAQQALISEFPDREFAAWLTFRLAEPRLTSMIHLATANVISHGDVFTDNLIVRPDDSLALIDWETVSLDSALVDLGMTLLGLAKVDGRLDRARSHKIVAGYLAERTLSAEELAALPASVEYAALIIAFHRYHRHNIRFPSERKSHLHIEMIGFVESLTDFAADIS